MVKGLGKGLGALFGETLQEEQQKVEELAIVDITTNPYQPRNHFDEEALQQLAQSIEQSGLIQPIIVRKKKKGYELVAGERRLRATQLLGQSTITAIVKELTDEQSIEYAILENLQREDLNAIEEAEAYARMIKELGVTQQQLAERLGKSRPYIANMMRLTQLPKHVQELILNQKLSVGHGRTLLSLQNKERMDDVITKVLTDHLNVRQLEEYIHQINNHAMLKEEKENKRVSLNPFIKKEQDVLQEYFGTKVKIKDTGKHKGKLEIEYMSLEDLERILELIKK